MILLYVLSSHIVKPCKYETWSHLNDEDLNHIELDILFFIVMRLKLYLSLKKTNSMLWHLHAFFKI